MVTEKELREAINLQTGKTPEQEAIDSARMLGIVILVNLFVGIGLLTYFLS